MAAILGVLILLLLAGTAVALALVAHGFSQSGEIASNVFIQQVPVAGKTVPEAIASLHTQWVPRLPEEVELVYPGGSVSVSRKDLGADLMLEKAAADAYRVGRVGNIVQRLATQWKLRHQPIHIEVECRVDQKPLDAKLADVATSVNKPPRNAQVSVSADDEVSITPHVNGLVVKLEESKAALLDALRRPDASEAKLVVEEQEPAITQEDLAHLEVVLSSYTTRFNPGQTSRSHNLRLATETLNKTVVMPGEVFSVNQIVGERTPERGYKRAPIFRDGGELFDDYGGGLCQVSSTVYNAALLANMTIVERSNHNRIVTYVPLGRDAMVNYGSIDMRWRNSLKHPVLVLGRVEGDELTIKIIGKRSDKVEVRIERSNVSTIPAPDKEIKDPELEEGKRVVEEKGWSGGRASARRLVKIGNEWKSNLSYSDYYPPGPNKIRVGTKKKEEKPEEPRIPRVPEGTEVDEPAETDPPLPDAP
jgi:vancomycin resistance protein YoaR